MLKRLPLLLIVLLIVILLQLVLMSVGYAATPVSPVETPAVATQHTVYPNPVSSTFNLHVAADAFDRFTVVNILGQVIIDSQIPLHAQDLHFDLSGEPEGTYFYALYRQGEVKVTRKLMKQ